MKRLYAKGNSRAVVAKLCKGGRVCLSSFHLSCKGKSSSNTDCVFMILKLRSTEREESHATVLKGEASSKLILVFFIVLC